MALNELSELEVRFSERLDELKWLYYELYYGDEHRGKVLKTRTWIDIDVGAGQGLPPALLRLDDFEVFYGE